MLQRSLLYAWQDGTDAAHCSTYMARLRCTCCSRYERIWCVVLIGSWQHQTRILTAILQKAFR